MRHYTGYDRDVTDKKLKVTFHRVLWCGDYCLGRGEYRDWSGGRCLQCTGR